MAAPRRPDTPVLVLDRHRIPGTNTSLKRRSGRQGQEALFGRSELRKEQLLGSDRMLKGENGTESSAEEGSPSQIVASVLLVSETLPPSKEAAKPAKDALSSFCAYRPPQSVPKIPRMPTASTPVTASLSPSAAMSCLPPPITPPPSPGLGTKTLAPSPTAAVTALSRTIYTVLTHSTPPAAPVPEGGARVEIESFPGQNEVDPSTGDAQIGVAALPGINQDTSNMGELSSIPSSTVTTGLRGPSSIPAITVNRPLPGQNQANPIMAEQATPPGPPVSPPPPPPSPPSSSLPPVNEPVSSSFSSSESTKILAPAIPTSTLSVQTLSIPLSSSFTPAPTTSFVTITRSEQGKEALPITVALSSIIPASATSASFSTTNIPTPQAIEIAQSFPGLLSSTTAIAAATLVPTALSGGQQDGSILHPTARTLLIMFVILGALSIVVTIVIYMMVKSHKKRSQSQQQALAIQYPYDASDSNVGSTTHISANSNDNPFLTASEKAIIDRAASSDGTSDATGQSSISDAISSFIKKSRRLTYKISP